MWAWGKNDHGQLGLGGAPATGSSDGCVFSPIAIPSLIGRPVIRIVAGYHNSGCVTRDGRCFVWGRGSEGQGAGEISEANDIVVPTAIPINFPPKMPSVTSGVEDLSLGWGHCLALRKGVRDEKAIPLPKLEEHASKEDEIIHRLQAIQAPPSGPESSSPGIRLVIKRTPEAAPGSVESTPWSSTRTPTATIDALVAAMAEDYGQYFVTDAAGKGISMDGARAAEIEGMLTRCDELVAVVDAITLESQRTLQV